MQLSHKIIKQGQSFTQDSRSFIQTAMTADKFPEEEEHSSEEQIVEPIEAAQARALLAETRQKEQAILSEAEKEANKLKEAAEKQGFEEGKTQGYEMGYTTGYAVGMKQADEESQRMRENIRNMLDEAQEVVENYYQAKKNEFIELAGHMAETIVHKNIDVSSDQVMDLINPVLHRLKREDQFITLMVRPEQKELVKEKVKEFEKENQDIRFAVLSDNTLDKNGCVVENAHAIVDLQVRKQLDAMIDEMKNAE
ncbi:FliH/SctL family protein [Carnobacterium sp.]|uniref:FliH/SctL family protein n=1 Tax=Carnobacterium sp. TaxID=48221 RepID=UPI00389114F3